MNFPKFILLSIFIFTLGFLIAFYLIKDNLFSKKEIMEAHGSFDERINLIDERVAVIEDATKSGGIKP